MIMALILIPLSVVLLGAAVYGFFWAVDHGQFEDVDTVAADLLNDETPADEPPAKESGTLP